MVFLYLLISSIIRRQKMLKPPHADINGTWTVSEKVKTTNDFFFTYERFMRVPNITTIKIGLKSKSSAMSKLQIFMFPQESFIDDVKVLPRRCLTGKNVTTIIILYGHAIFFLCSSLKSMFIIVLQSKELGRPGYTLAVVVQNVEQEKLPGKGRASTLLLLNKKHCAPMSPRILLIALE